MASKGYLSSNHIDFMLVRRIASEHLCSTASHSKGNVITQKIADRRAHSDLEEATVKGIRL